MVVVQWLPEAVGDVFVQVEPLHHFPARPHAAPQVDRVPVLAQPREDLVHPRPQLHIPRDDGVVHVEEDVHESLAPAC
ncbi:MAG: hypothetical protein IPH65_16180 [Dehalococcoidia bacterium]|uniref:hypothetical protein n=1 Tax=Candidatus Amarobacter glycogenicus TaxID=3140699 RepID=UPI003135ADD8|nr:hypothetical protein [Dehalococcoidia bacterium]